MISSKLLSALRAAAIHFSVTLLVALLVSVLVFFVWYPWPFYDLVPGKSLFWLVMGIDVVCGPLLTLVIWNPSKSSRELALDLSLVALIQLAALGYGIHNVYNARPVHLVFEVDRLRLVTASEIEHADLPQALPEFQSLPWHGPTLASAREPKDNDELLKSVELSTAGIDPSLRPSWWQAYELGVPTVLARAKPLSVLVQARPEAKADLDAAIRQSGRPENELVWLPFTSGANFDWVVLLDKKDGQPLAFAPIDGFL
jgi:hypothetical protein